MGGRKESHKTVEILFPKKRSLGVPPITVMFPLLKKCSKDFGGTNSIPRNFFPEKKFAQPCGKLPGAPFPKTLRNPVEKNLLFPFKGFFLEEDKSLPKIFNPLILEKTISFLNLIHIPKKCSNPFSQLLFFALKKLKTFWSPGSFSVL